MTTKTKTTKKKVASKKASTKKTSAKKASTKKKKVLVCAADDQCFWTTDGRIIQDVEELSKALEAMTDEVFSYHVGGEKNDFATWVEDVLDDKTLARKLRKVSNRLAALKEVTKRLSEYTK